MAEQHARWLKAGNWLVGLEALAILAAVIATGMMFHDDPTQPLAPGVYLGLFGSLILTGALLLVLDVALARAVRLYPGFQILKMRKRAGSRLDFRRALFDAYCRGEMKSLQEGNMGYLVPSVCCLCLGKADAKKAYEVIDRHSHEELGRKSEVTMTVHFRICQACSVINGASGRWLSAAGASMIVVGGLAIYAYLQGDVPDIGPQCFVLMAALVLPVLPAAVAVSWAPRPVKVLGKAAEFHVANPGYAALLLELNPKWTVVGTSGKGMAAGAG